MKKSEIYKTAMEVVVESELRTDVKLEILDVLMADKKLAEFAESTEAEEAEK